MFFSLCLMIDFELQAGMVELIFRLIPGDTRHKKARGYFSCDLVSSAFCDITSPEFEAVSTQIIKRAINYFRMCLWLCLHSHLKPSSNYTCFTSLSCHSLQCTHCCQVYHLTWFSHCYVDLVFMFCSFFSFRVVETFLTP